MRLPIFLLSTFAVSPAIAAIHALPRGAAHRLKWLCLGLANVKVDGEYLVKGKSVTGFSNTEEEGVGLTKVGLCNAACLSFHASSVNGNAFQILIS